MNASTLNVTPAQALFAGERLKFGDETVRKHILLAAEAARTFLTKGKGRYIEGGLFDSKQNILSDQELELLKDANVSRFLRAGNAEIARKRGFSNGLNHALNELVEDGLIEAELLRHADEAVFDMKTLLFLDLLERRRQSQVTISQMTLSEVVGEFYATISSNTTQKVRDERLVPLCQLGLVTGTYKEGAGYAFKAGPVLTATVTLAVEAFYGLHDL